MTEDQFYAALRVVQQFLACRGFDERLATAEVQDGHWLLQMVQEQLAVPAPTNRLSVLLAVLTKLENGSYFDGTPLLNQEGNPWSSACSDCVRQCAGLA